MTHLIYNQNDWFIMHCLFSAVIWESWYWNFSIIIGSGIGHDSELSWQYPGLHVIMWSCGKWKLLYPRGSQASNHMTFLIMPSLRKWKTFRSNYDLQILQSGAFFLTCRHNTTKKPCNCTSTTSMAIKLGRMVNKDKTIGKNICKNIVKNSW